MGFLYHLATDAHQQSPTDLPNIRARSIELVDSKGVSRALLSTEPDGTTVFRIKDEDGTIRVKLAGNKDGSGLVLLNDKTEPGVHMLSKTAGGSITIADQNGRKKQLAP